MSWLVTLSSVCSSKPEANERTPSESDLLYTRPPVFIVGTHADRKQDQDVKEMELQIAKEISEKDYESHVIRPFFSVDNTQGSSDEGVAALQKKIIEVLKKEPYMGEEIPLRYTYFQSKVIQSKLNFLPSLHSFFFLRTFFHKNVQPEICQNVKNMLRTYWLREEQFVFYCFYFPKTRKSEHFHNFLHGIRVHVKLLMFFHHILIVYVNNTFALNLFNPLM